MTVKERKKFDSLVSRILFFELAIAAIAIGILVLSTNSIIHPLTILFGGTFILAGLFCLYSCFALSDGQVSKWAENTGNHEVMFLFIGLAYGLASLFRGSR
jgi:hypothetical protein